MSSANYLESLEKEKEDHAKIFYELLKCEEIIDSGNFDYEGFIHAFYKILNLLSKHEKHEKDLLNEISSRGSEANLSRDMILIDPRKIRGHVKVIIEAIKSRDIDYLRTALDNDGRMFISRIKEQIFKEEKILDSLLFLHLVH